MIKFQTIWTMAAIAILISVPGVAMAQVVECSAGTTEIKITLPNGSERSVCMPDEAVEGLENNPTGGGGIIEVATCPCATIGDVDFLDTIIWTPANGACTDESESQTDIVFALDDFVALPVEGTSRAVVTGGTFAKGNRCQWPNIQIGASFMQNFDGHTDISDGEVAACVRDLSFAAEHLGVTVNECNLTGAP